MHFGVISDIHGNLRALQAVWRVFEQTGLAERPVLNAGDNVGYGAAPEECVRFLRAHPNVVTVQGNYDKNVAQFPVREAEFRKKWGRSRAPKFEALRADSAVISDETRAWLLDLPREVEFTLAGIRVLVTHYAPGSKEGLGRWTDDRRLAALADTTSAQVVVCGHTHSPFVRCAGRVLWVNPGALGRSYFDSAPSYAVLTLTPGQPPSAEIKRAGMV